MKRAGFRLRNEKVSGRVCNTCKLEDGFDQRDQESQDRLPISFQLRAIKKMIFTASAKEGVALLRKGTCTNSDAFDERRRSRRSLDYFDSHRSVTVVLSLLLVMLSYLAGSICATSVRRNRCVDRTHLVPSIASLRSSDNAVGAWVCPVRSHGTDVFDTALLPPKCEDDEGTNDAEEEDFVRKHLLVDVLFFRNETLLTTEGLLDFMKLLLGVLHEQLLSYSCMKTTKTASCVGVARRSRVSIRSFNQSDYVAFDVFTYGQASLISVLPALEHLLIAANSGAHPQIKWTQKIRADFREGVDRTLSEAGVGNINIRKRLVESIESDFQHIHIWDRNRPGNHCRIESQHESIYGLSGDLDRIVYLDDTSQSRKYGEAPYHEGLVHPAMFTQEYPRRVAIIGGGEGATLREILKHNTVQKVLMIEIDRVMVETSRKFLPEWSYCGNLVGSAESCFDDPRVELHFSDAMAWFIDHFRDRSSIDPGELFDVVIMDALDPSTVVEFSDVLYKSDDLVIALYNGLSPRGVFSIQIGQSTSMDEPPMTHLRDNQLASLLHHFMEVGFQRILHCDEMHSGFQAPWAYLVVIKDEEARFDWFRGQAEVELAIRKRSIRTWNNESPFRYFDGSTMMSWKFPQRPVEEVWCRTEPRPSVCRGHGFDPLQPKYASSWLVESFLDSGALKRESITNCTTFVTVNRVHADQRAISIISSLSEGTRLQLWHQLQQIVIAGTVCLRKQNMTTMFRRRQKENPLYLAFDPYTDRHYPHCGLCLRSIEESSSFS